MEIYKVEPDDIGSIKPLWESLNRLHRERSSHFKKHFSKFTFEQRLAQFEDRDELAVFAARTQTGIIGYCIASVSGTVGEIDSIYILPDRRESGIGDCLMDKAESWLKGHRVEKVRTCVAQGNEMVYGFYMQRGYYPRYTVLEK